MSSQKLGFGLVQDFEISKAFYCCEISKFIYEKFHVAYVGTQLPATCEVPRILERFILLKKLLCENYCVMDFQPHSLLKGIWL